MAEEFKAIFNGEASCWVGFVKREDNKVYIKVPRKFFPMFSTWKLMASNIGELMDMYEEYKLFSFDEGLTEELVRFYPFDIHTFKLNFVRIHPQFVRQMQNLKAENNYLSMRIKEAEERLRRGAQQDLMKAHVKDDYGFWTGLKPAYAYAQDEKKKGSK